MKGANEFLEKEYWPEWNERFARSLTGMVDLHRRLTAQQDLAASLSHCGASRHRQRLHLSLLWPPLSDPA